MKSITSKEVTIEWIPDKNNKEPLYKQIVRFISTKIASGDWVIGSKLPSQRKLAEIFGVNRSTIMMAMEELSSYGILEGNAGKGTRVASNTWSLLMSAAPPDWGSYLTSGSFKANVPTIQIINKLEFEEDYIRLGTGELAPELFPKEMMREIFMRLPERIPSLNYLGSLGLLELREILSERLKKQGIQASPSSILITSGSLQALQLISVCMLPSGSTVYTEAPSYLKSLQVFQSAGMKLKGLPMDSEGLCHWHMATQSHHASNSKGLTKEKNSLLYTIPTFHNPTGAVMSTQRRKELFRFCNNQRLPIIEDNAYGELWFEEEPPKPLKTMDENGMILYLGTVSKTIAPGLRIGWLVGPESVVERLGDVKMQMDYGASSVSQWALYELFSTENYDIYLQQLRKKLKMRRDHALHALELYFKDIATWNVPKGSFYIWLKLHHNISTDDLFYAARKEKLLLNPGSVYDFEKNHALRLSYAYAKEEEIEYGLKKLSNIIRSNSFINASHSRPNGSK